MINSALVLTSVSVRRTKLDHGPERVRSQGQGQGERQRPRSGCLRHMWRICKNVFCCTNCARGPCRSGLSSVGSLKESTDAWSTHDSHTDTQPSVLPAGPARATVHCPAVHRAVNSSVWHSLFYPSVQAQTRVCNSLLQTYCQMEQGAVRVSSYVGLGQWCVCRRTRQSAFADAPKFLSEPCTERGPACTGAQPHRQAGLTDSKPAHKLTVCSSGQPASSS